MPETKAGSSPGARLFGLSLKRAGDSMIEATGRPGAFGESPVVAHKGAKFSPSGTARAGSTAGGSYSPFPPTAGADYKGGVGTGQGKGSQGSDQKPAKRSCSGDNC
jgi:hypothetical protein